ncbi:chromosomal replication initiator protein DnaA [Blastomonas aquatica]|uniref:Chromosomal replication initiator protein DnaA n=2 Tax=Blastomonas aquatica TaxID=1510276 RepID=A0ABQ1JKH3_9SPHN|nr:chromosomal replication initiator protein DnaA [Blastomonas aquatica]GGB71250.1 chromosomal replication initiator protein DnaA [Blastomonas aquatica]
MTKNQEVAVTGMIDMNDSNGAADWAADWNEISEGLRKDLGAQIHTQWIRPIRPGSFDPGSGMLNLHLPSEFSANWVRERFADRLALAWKIVRPEVRSVTIAAAPRDTDLARPRAAAAAPQMAAPAPRAPLGEAGNRISLDPSQVFGGFITGQSNVLAFNAAQRMAAMEKPLFSPLYLKAATGQGKTHLLHAIGNAFAEVNPGARICYCPAEKFMNDFVSAIQRGDSMAFKARLRGFDMLLVDDIQFIIGKNSTQEEFLHTIDAILGAGKRLVVTSDRAPQALDGVDQRLLSRLAMGLVADIQPADIELRRAIISARIATMRMGDVPEDVIEFLARTISRNVRELVGGLNKLMAYAQITGQKVTLPLAEEQLSDLLSANRRRITIDEIQRAVCQFYKVDRSEMSSKRRARAVVRPRQVAMYLAKVLTPRSYPEIGRKFGGRDHSTVIHAVRLIEDLRTRDADMDGDVRALLQQLES